MAIAEAGAAYIADKESERRNNPVGYARSILRRFPMWKLEGAEVYPTKNPDMSNPGGYYDRWVVLKYKTHFGIPREKILYFEQTASDEDNQEKVLAYATRVLETIRALRS